MAIRAQDDSEALAEFKRQGEPAKFVIRPGAGPLATLKSSDAETLNAYLRVAQLP